MDAKQNLHLRRVQEGLDKIAEIRHKKFQPSEAEFKTWYDRTLQSLGEIFGNDKGYTKSFRILRFSGPSSISTGFSRHRSTVWSERDQQLWDAGLTKAEHILRDAIEEYGIAPPTTTQPPEHVATRPQYVINITNTLSQISTVQVSQILTTLADLGLSPEDQSRAEAEAEALAAEVEGQQRWPILAKSLDVLKSLGKPVYERVALPLLSELLKKQMGL